MRTHRYCNRCGSEVKKETKVKQYPFYCPMCDENMFYVETFKYGTYKKQRNKGE